MSIGRIPQTNPSSIRASIDEFFFRDHSHGSKRVPENASKQSPPNVTRALRPDKFRRSPSKTSGQQPTTRNQQPAPRRFALSLPLPAASPTLSAGSHLRLCTKPFVSSCFL